MFTGAEESVQSRAAADVGVEWCDSAISQAVTADAASSCLRLELPVGFTGSKLSVLEQTPEGDYAPVYAGAELVEAAVVAATAGFNALIPLAQLLGLANLKLVSDQTETCRGVLRGAA